MTDQTTDTPENENIGLAGVTPVVIHKQYLKDLSFENPNAPDILKKVEQRPAMDLNIGMDVQRYEPDGAEGDFYEVTLTVNAQAMRQDKAMFIAEVIYGAVVSIKDLPEKQHHPVLFIEVPQLLFPFVRQILSSVTQNGGYMPLQLAPVDFKSMYLNRFAQDKDESNAEKAENKD